MVPVEVLILGAVGAGGVAFMLFLIKVGRGDTVDEIAENEESREDPLSGVPVLPESEIVHGPFDMVEEWEVSKYMEVFDKGFGVE